MTLEVSSRTESLLAVGVETMSVDLVEFYRPITLATHSIGILFGRCL